MKVKFIAPPLTNGRVVLAKSVRYWVMKIARSDELHLNLNGWDYVVYDKHERYQNVVAQAELIDAKFRGSLNLNVQISWAVEGKTAKELIRSTQNALAKADWFYR
jgi:hypothetical protein